VIEIVVEYSQLTDEAEKNPSAKTQAKEPRSKTPSRRSVARKR
jgi:hypothetical protein